MIPVIISGGSGSRLWPVSRQLDPKPFIKLSGGVSLLQNTFSRATTLNDVNAVLTVTNEKIYFRMQDEYQQINTQNLKCDFILEPYGRNTAPAIAAACLFVAKNYSPDEIILILPADHLINDFVNFSKSVDDAVAIAKLGYITTFGINPEYPETGYGYIEADKNNPIGNGYAIKRFVEKPNIKFAQEYLDSGNYQWNSGMFCGRVDVFLNEFAIHATQLLNVMQYCMNKSHVATLPSGTVMHLNRELFLQTENISIDYALFEKSHLTAVLPCTIGWSDIGSWLSIAQTIPKDSNNNAIIGESVLHNTHDCLLYSTDRIIAGVDISNLIVVDTPDAVLIADKHYSQNVKIIFERLKNMNHQTSELHQTTHHPWGTYTILEEGPFYKVKRLEVKAGSSLPVQVHKHFSEHWIVVDGVASVTNNDRQFQLMTNQSICINADSKHLLENKTEKNLVVIEVQCG